MKRQYFLLLVLSVLVIGFSCSKKTDSTSTPTSTSTSTTSGTTTTTTTGTTTPSAISMHIVSGSKNTDTINMQLNFLKFNPGDTVAVINSAANGGDGSTDISIRSDKVVYKKDTFKIELNFHISDHKASSYSLTTGSTSSATLQFTDGSINGTNNPRNGIQYGQQYTATIGTVDLQTSGTAFPQYNGGLVIGNFNAYFAINGDDRHGINVPSGGGKFQARCHIN